MKRNRSQPKPGALVRACLMLAAGAAALCSLPLTASPSRADPADAPPDDFYIRSTSRSGQFHGYHQILAEPQKGFIKAVYCDRAFWVQKDTVIWTQFEAQAGRKLVVEANDINERRVLCENPQNQVTLEDLGLNDLELARLRQEKDGVGGNRLKIIGEAFKGFK